jgi:hypothetical protein
MSKNIEFIATGESTFLAFDKPVPIEKVLPQWYKSQGKYSGGNKMVLASNGNPNHTIKACMPVFDMMTAGYVISLPADVYFSRDENNSINSSWSTDLIKLIESHPVDQYDKFKIPDGYDPVALKIVQPWIIKTPPGYSCLFIQPSYIDESPFMMLPAIVDTDKHPLPVNFPFFIKKDFEGIVEHGTPIIQIIPFRREDWTHTTSFDDNNNAEKAWQIAKKRLLNRYKTFYRTKKNWK